MQSYPAMSRQEMAFIGLYRDSVPVHHQTVPGFRSFENSCDKQQFADGDRGPSEDQGQVVDAILYYVSTLGYLIRFPQVLPFASYPGPNIGAFHTYRPCTSNNPPLSSVLAVEAHEAHLPYTPHTLASP
jgi:hypothetical protein